MESYLVKTFINVHVEEINLFLNHNDIRKASQKMRELNDFFKKWNE